jgi:ferritin-like metal-binding protein YciE
MLGTKVKAVDGTAIDGIIEEANEAGEVADQALIDAPLNQGRAAVETTKLPSTAA